MNAINWPAGYLPGTTDNFVSNEVIVAGIGAADVWAVLIDTSTWPIYYSNIANIRFRDAGGPLLTEASRLRFDSFGLEVEAAVTEFSPPMAGQPGRVSWHGWVEGDIGSAHRLDVIHAWLVEELDGRRVRVLTQEPQRGELAREMAQKTPNPALNAHQEWVVGVVDLARRRRHA